MKKAIAFVLVMFTVSMSANAAPKGSINRGGLGFLFSDTNRFTNPGQFSMLKGFAGEVDYNKNGDTGTSAVTPSMVFGSGRVGVGVFAKREGTSLSTTGAYADSAGAGLGFNFAKEKVSMGVGFQRSLAASPANDGTVSGTITLHPGNKGFSIGGGGSTTLTSGTAVQTAVGAIGYAFNPMVMVEAVVNFNDLTNTGDLSISGYLTLSGKRAYLSGGFTNNRGIAQSAAEGRLGVILGSNVDLSVHGGKTFTTGSEFQYGGSFRVRL